MCNTGKILNVLLQEITRDTNGWNSAPKVTLSHTCSDMKVYVCDECPKRFCTALELKRHQLLHSDYRQFSCFLCNATFTSKQCVKKHIMKCSAVDVTSACVLALYSFFSINFISLFASLCYEFQQLFCFLCITTFKYRYNV